MINIAVFGSGSGTNAQQLMQYFQNHDSICVKLILSNKQDAYILERAKTMDIENFVFNKNDFYESSIVLEKLKNCKISFIVLAGFLWLFPENIINAFPKKVINIHPALLPKYGGKGMYGKNVHKAVIESGDKESGISIHYVNNNYDEGDLICQAVCPIYKQDTIESLAERIHELEYKFLPLITEKIILNQSLQ